MSVHRRRPLLAAPVFAVFLLKLVGCASQQSLHVVVATPTGEPIADATVACVCTPSGDAGAVTDEEGSVELAVFNSDPETCIVTIAKPGFHTRQVTVEDLAAPLSVETEESGP